MNVSFRNLGAVVGGFLVLGFVLDVSRAQAQPFDHLACTRVRDLRNVPAFPPLTLTAEQVQFLASTGCRVSGRFAKATEVCWPVDKDPGGPPPGLDLTGQDFLCYKVRCAPNGGGQTPITITDQFGTGTVIANQRHVGRKLCVPAFKGPVATATAQPTPTPTPTAVVTPTPTPTPVVTPTPTPTPVYGSASRAFVQKVPSLLY